MKKNHRSKTLGRLRAPCRRWNLFTLGKMRCKLAGKTLFWSNFAGKSFDALEKKKSSFNRTVVTTCRKAALDAAKVNAYLTGGTSSWILRSPGLISASKVLMINHGVLRRIWLNESKPKSFRADHFFSLSIEVEPRKQPAPVLQD